MGFSQKEALEFGEHSLILTNGSFGVRYWPDSASRAPQNNLSPMSRMPLKAVFQVVQPCKSNQSSQAKAETASL